MKTPTSQQLSNQLGNTRRASRKHRRFALAVGLGLLLSVGTGLQAQTIWRGTGGTGGNGTWSTGGEWSAGVPVSGTDARFQVDAISTATSAVIQVSGSQAANSFQAGRGKATTLQLASGASITATGAESFFSHTYGTGTSSASYTFEGPASGTATVNFRALTAYGNTAGGGSSLTFTGSNLVVTATTADNSIGRSQNGATLSILSGAKMTTSRIALGREASNNTLLVSGAGSSLNATLNLNIGTGNAPSNNDNNILRVESGGYFTTSAATTIGLGIGSSGNTLQVTGSNSEAILADTQVGNSGANNVGGNSVQVDNGGVVRNGNALSINSYDASGTNSGANFVLVGANGTLTSNNTITVRDKAALRLAATGKIEGRDTAGVAATATISVLSGGRFEAAGSGLGAVTTVNTTVSSGGSLAVGLDSAVAASTLSFSNTNSKMTLNTSSTLEFGLFGNGLNDSIAFSAINIMTVQSGVNLRLTLQAYAPVDGNSWTLITGAGFASGSAANLAGATFVLPTLGVGLSWNTTQFNEGNGWGISVVPEPSSLMLFGASLGALLIFRRRRA